MPHTRTKVIANNKYIYIYTFSFWPGKFSKAPVKPWYRCSCHLLLTCACHKKKSSKVRRPCLGNRNPPKKKTVRYFSPGFWTDISELNLHYIYFVPIIFYRCTFEHTDWGFYNCSILVLNKLKMWLKNYENESAENLIND